jgi:hypothetical protein
LICWNHSSEHAFGKAPLPGGAFGPKTAKHHLEVALLQKRPFLVALLRKRPFLVALLRKRPFLVALLVLKVALLK